MSRPDTHEMIVIHRVYRRESALLPGLIAGVADGDTGRAEVVGGYAQDYLAALHLHHTLEDELVWPLLRDRARIASDLVDRMEEQHERVDRTVQELTQTLPKWRESADPALRTTLVASADRHRTALVEHLDDEEEHVLTLIEAHLSVGEWEMMGRVGGQRTPRDKGFLTLGALLEEAEASEARIFLNKLPKPALALWYLVGRRQYRRYAAKARG
jgi:hemerythrin-like domain-containing protein